MINFDSVESYLEQKEGSEKELLIASWKVFKPLLLKDDVCLARLHLKRRGDHWKLETEDSCLALSKDFAEIMLRVEDTISSVTKNQSNVRRKIYPTSYGWVIELVQTE